uniref:Putative secreted protein n=1 Tax=Rhipicephalus microplus TaxID=6941 RepID=A0A6G5A2R2_RHIMP
MSTNMLLALLAWFMGFHCLAALSNRCLAMLAFSEMLCRKKYRRWHTAPNSLWVVCGFRNKLQFSNGHCKESKTKKQHYSLNWHEEIHLKWRPLCSIQYSSQ